MGTRGLTKVILDGNVRVAQYGQWDHYAECAGVYGLDFARRLANKETFDDFKEKVRKITLHLNFEPKDNWLKMNSRSGDGYLSSSEYAAFKEAFPYFDRDIGYQIVDHILGGGVTDLEDASDFEADNLFCEGVLSFNLDNETYQFNDGPVYKFDALPTDEEFLSNYTEVDEY